MKKLIFSCLIVLTLTLPSQSWATAAACSGAICYVDNTSTGTGDGTSYATTGAHAAFKTIAEVNALTYAQDTQILFNRGQTWREQLNVPSSGASSHPIIIGAYGSGVAPIISGADLITTWTNVPGSETGGLFIADAETNNASQFTGVTTAGTATFAAGNVYAHGSHGFTMTSDNTSNAFGYETFGSAQTDTYLRLYVKFDSSYTQDDYATQVLGVITADNATTCYIGAYKASPNWTFAMFRGYGDYGATIDTTPISLNTWYRLELHEKDASVVGGGGCYLSLATGDGSSTEIGSYPYDRSARTSVSAQVGSAINHHASNGKIIYFDDVKVATSAIGAYSAGSTNVYTKSIGTTAPGVVVFGGTLGNNVANTGALAANGEWTYSNPTLSVYRTTAPDTEFASGIDVGQRDLGISIPYGSSYITVQDLSVKNTSIHTVHANTSSNIILQRLSLSNAGGTYGSGIHGLALSSSTVQNNTTSKCSSHIFLEQSSNNNIIQDNDFGYSQIMMSGGGASSLHISGSTGNIVRRNYIHDARPYPTSGSDRQGDCMYIDVGGDSNQIYYNMCYQTNDGIDIYGNSNLVYNNTIYNCRYQAIGLSPTEAGSPDSNIIKNNILHTAANNHMVLAAANTAGTSNVIDNNVLYDAAGGNIVAWASTAENWGNMTFAQWQAHSKYDLHSVNADPLFVSTSDFHLQAGSPAINTGVDVGLTTDYAGHTVPIGPYPDIGAYEADYIPNAFTFTDITGATRTTDYVSNSITVAGTDTASAITITGGTYSKNAAAYTSNAGTVVATDTVTVKVASSGSYSTAVNAALTIGTVSDTYTVTTGSAPASGQNFMSPGNFLRKPKGIF